MTSRNIAIFILLMAFTLVHASPAQETLPPLKEGVAPHTFEALWAGYDPRAEPLEVETLKAWEEDGVVLRVVRYRIGIFKGRKAMMAAVYGYPKGGSNLPGLVQIHGGGQYADYRAVLTNAKRGYATISIAWAGRISAPGYLVNPDIVKRFWAGNTAHPDYKLTTDWGALDAYHAPCRNPKNGFAHIRPAAWTLDAVESPRNNPWFLVTLGARRALTFLEQQAQVDADRLGVYGHSMGGKLTVMCAGADARVKAAAPSCGGISNRPTDNAIYSATLSDSVYLKRITCPIIFLSPSNDFHGRLNDLPTAVQEINSPAWRVTCSAHGNHQDNAPFQITGLLWFDQYLKRSFTFPKTAQTSLTLKTQIGNPALTVQPDTSRQILSVDVFYTQHGQMDGEKDDRENTKSRFWRHAPARRNLDTWTADLPLVSADKPLWAYANVLYPLDESTTGAGYYYGLYTAETFNVSSLVQMVTPDQIQAAGVVATLKPSLMIETFEIGWEKEWFTYKPEAWPRRTHKLHDEQWQAPPKAKLAFEVRSVQSNALVIGLDQYAAEIQLTGGLRWQSIVLCPADFKNAAGQALSDWSGIRELRLGDQETLREKDLRRNLGARWQGDSPAFRRLRWVVERTVMPGESVQEAIDEVSVSGGGVVTLAAGKHDIIFPVQMKSNVTLQGEGKLASTLSTTRDIKMEAQSGNVSDASIIDSRRLAIREKAAPLRFFVSLQGDDVWSGRVEHPSTQSGDGPFRTLEAARDAVRNLSHEERREQPIEICILPGTYVRKQALRLDARDSGTENAPVVYRSWAEKPVVISGGTEVREWARTELNGRSVLVSDLSKLPGGYAPFEQLWVNGHRVIQARTPNRGYLKIPAVPKVEQDPAAERRAKTSYFAYAPADEHHFDGVQEGVAVIFNKWLAYHMPLDRVDRQKDMIVCSKQSGRALEIEDHFYLEGGRAMLDQPGEWYLDRQVNKLYYYPLAGESEVVATIPLLVTVLQVEGDADSGKWVEHVQFRGLNFSHTTWVLPRDSGPSGYSQSDIRMDGAVRLLDAKNCLFEKCEITAIGNYGLEIGPGCSKNRVLRCDIHDLGAGGVLLGPKIRPPSDKENPNRQDFPPVLESPSDACSHNEIADCRIYDGGRYYHCAVGIWIGQSPDNHVHHNEIYDFYYSSISSGWTWGYGRGLATGNRFEYNHIHHIGRLSNGDGPVLSDLGGIYTLGDQTGTVIRHNVFHDIWAGKYGGWAIYCDEGSRNILIENNLAYRCRHSCFNQHYGKDNIVRNNIFAFADTSVVMLAKAQAHTGFVLTNNILLSDGTPIYAGGYAHKVNSGGAFKADHNLVWSTTSRVLGAQDRFPSRLYEPDEPVLSWDQWQAMGYDPHTMIADPRFKDPANGDFRLPENSPAIKIGFKPFALDEAGPR